MPKFFSDDSARQQPPAVNAPRGFTASAAKIDLSKRADSTEKRKPSSWQTAAWGFYDQIGELHFAFNLIGQILSRIRLYAAVVDEPDSPPIRTATFLNNLEEKHEVNAEKTRKILEGADDALHDLVSNSPGMGSGLMRELGINLSVSGEAYLLKHNKKWMIASTDELKSSGDNFVLDTDRATRSTSNIPLPKSAFVARVWRSHPRYSNEPDSSMAGVLDACEQLVLLTKAIRMMTRSRMNAGVIFIPEGLASSMDDEDDPSSVEEALIAAAVSPLENESAATSVVPLVITGPAQLGKELKKIDLGRAVDEQMVRLTDTTLSRILNGIDVPKDVVQGLSDVKYSNAIVIDDNLYRAHIEPLALMIVDALTQVYLRPTLRKMFPGMKSELFDRTVIWFDPSAIVTRPDKSTAANEGFDRNILSESAWRTARGFNEHDAPDEEELLTRLAMSRAQIPPDMAAALIERIAPGFFAAERSAAQATSGMPDDISSLLDGGEGTSGMDALGEMFKSDTQPATEKPSVPEGQVPQGGTMPPRQ